MMKKSFVLFGSAAVAVTLLAGVCLFHSNSTGQAAIGKIISIPPSPMVTTAQPISIPPSPMVVGAQPISIPPSPMTATASF